jgi:peptidoglycan/LPS O-acetylase OafA/YrhL
LKTFRRPFPQTFCYRSILWFLLCGIFIYKAVKRRLSGDWEIVFVLSFSSILYALAYFPTAPSTEFRYLFWSAVSSAVAVIFGIYLWRTEKREANLKEKDEKES